MEKEVSKVPLIKYAWLRILLFLISFLIVTGFTTFLSAMIMQVDIADMHNVALAKGMSIVFSIVSLVSLLIVAWVFRVKIDRKPFNSLGFSIRNRWKDMLLGFIIGFLLIFIGFMILYYTGNIEIVSTNFEFSTLFFGIVLFAVAGFSEELMFRGYVLNNLLESTNKYLALFFSALIFTALHGFNPNLSFLGLLNIFLAGILLGVSYIHTKNLWFPTFLHLSWNFFQGSVFGFEVSGNKTGSIIEQKITGNELLTGGAFGFEGSIVAVVLIIIAIFAIQLFYSKKQNVYY